jgi:CubicO group peptidase (beta-lactamase class C family)
LGDGGVYSSLNDLAKWDAALGNHILLSEKEMQPGVTPVKPQVGLPEEPNGKPAEYGFGWFLNSYKNHHRMWHYGETVGFRSTIQRFPDDGLTIIMLCNRSDLSPTDQALRVSDIYLSRQ